MAVIVKGYTGLLSAKGEQWPLKTELLLNVTPAASSCPMLMSRSMLLANEMALSRGFSFSAAIENTSQ